jgi:hypothetical protein
MRKNELARAVGVTPGSAQLVRAGPVETIARRSRQLALALGVPGRSFILGHPAPTTPGRTLSQPPGATTQLKREQALAYRQLAWRLMTGIERYVELPAGHSPECVRRPRVHRERLCPAGPSDTPTPTSQSGETWPDQTDDIDVTSSLPFDRLTDCGRWPNLPTSRSTNQ